MKQQLKKVELIIFRIQGKKHHALPIEDYLGYFATTLGKVISCVGSFRGSENKPRGTSEPNILKQKVNNSGYKRVVLTPPGGRPKQKLVHRLVAETFLERPDFAPNPKEPFLHDLEPRIQVNHIDGNKLNNRISNLEWNSPKENYHHQQLSECFRKTKKKIIHKDASEEPHRHPLLGITNE
jgi:hypothetical protein